MSIAALIFGVSAPALGPLDLADGRWEVDRNAVDDRGDYTCEKDPLSISVDAAAMRVTLRRKRDLYEAAIVETREDAFRIKFDENTALEHVGYFQSVWWVRDGRNHFRWSPTSRPTQASVRFNRCRPLRIAE